MFDVYDKSKARIKEHYPQLEEAYINYLTKKNVSYFLNGLADDSLFIGLHLGQGYNKQLFLQTTYNDGIGLASPTLDSVLKWQHEFLSQNYISVNTYYGNAKGREEDKLHKLVRIVIDVDFNNHKAISFNDAMNIAGCIMKYCEFKPTYVVYSGRGLQFVFNIEEQWCRERDKKRYRYANEKLQEAIELVLSEFCPYEYKLDTLGENSVCRLPLTLNAKGGLALVIDGSEREIDYDALCEDYGEIDIVAVDYSTKLVDVSNYSPIYNSMKANYQLIVEKVEEGQRHKMFFSYAYNMFVCGQGLDATIKEALELNNKLKQPEEERVVEEDIKRTYLHYQNKKKQNKAFPFSLAKQLAYIGVEIEVIRGFGFSSDYEKKRCERNKIKRRAAREERQMQTIVKYLNRFIRDNGEFRKKACNELNCSYNTYKKYVRLGRKYIEDNCKLLLIFLLASLVSKNYTNKTASVLGVDDRALDLSQVLTLKRIYLCLRLKVPPGIEAIIRSHQQGKRLVCKG